MRVKSMKSPRVTGDDEVHTMDIYVSIFKSTRRSFHKMSQEREEWEKNELCYYQKGGFKITAITTELDGYVVLL